MSTPQLLTEKQLEEICNAIPINRALPPLVAQSVIQKVRTKLRADMKTVKIYPEIFPKFKNEIVKYYHKTMAQAGEAVGIITAQSIGERQTQTTLNTFHSAGLTIKSVVVGVPRFSELLNATKDPKMVNCLIYLTEPFEDIAGIRKRIGNTFTEITLKKLYKSSEFIKGPLEKWHHLFCNVYDIDASNLGWRIPFELNKDVVYEYQVRLPIGLRSLYP